MCVCGGGGGGGEGGGGGGLRVCRGWKGPPGVSGGTGHCVYTLTGQWSTRPATDSTSYHY